MTKLHSIETIEFLPPAEGEPSAAELVYGLAGVTAALDHLTTMGADDGDLLGNVAVAANCLASLLVHRMAGCPVGVPADAA
jgi:hypothetical protein